MPYCPKCDMEFVEGITVCSDCGGPLVESEEAAAAARLTAEREQEQKEGEELLDQIKEQYRSAQTERAGAPASGDIPETPKAPAAPSVYIRKSQKYEDLKSSAWAFLLVGGALLVFAALAWTGVLPIPMTGFSRGMFQTLLAVMGVGSLLIAALTAKNATVIAAQIPEEERQTQDILQWFQDSFCPEDIDLQIGTSPDELAFEELSLKRFEIIQDLLVTGRDLPDQSYVEMLSEEIYKRLYEA